jgi:uncharacterized DUF497 family protein
MPRAGRPAFDWDDANYVHIARHGVAPAEAEQIVLGASLPLESDERSDEIRHTELGETTEGRLLLVVWTWRRAGFEWRPRCRRIGNGAHFGIALKENTMPNNESRVAELPVTNLPAKRQTTIG